MPRTKEWRDSDGDSPMIIRCMACGEIHPGREDGSGLSPVGTDGTCVCGGDIFERR